VGARLGGGGMGEVFEAVQEDLGRRVAIKVMSGPFAHEPTLIERFQREARAVAALGHPHIVQVTDFQNNPGEPPFFVMERLVGESLGERIERSGPLDPDRIGRVAEQVLSALAAAHEAGLVHRDVKPDNVFLCHTDTGDDLVKLLDFGVAKVLEEQGPGRLTGTGAIVGTLAYMAPEQAYGDAVDARADVYALGACMYHALTGRPPYDAPTAARLLAAVAGTEPAPLDLLRPGLPPALRAIVVTAMARDPAARFPSARIMLAQVSAWLRGDSTILATGPVTGGQVAVRVNATGAPTPFSAPPPSPYAAASGPPPPPPWGILRLSLRGGPRGSCSSPPRSRSSASRRSPRRASWSSASVAAPRRSSPSRAPARTRSRSLAPRRLCPRKRPAPPRAWRLPPAPRRLRPSP
jgi:serine/threonine-protein kinase